MRSRLAASRPSAVGAKAAAPRGRSTGGQSTVIKPAGLQSTLSERMLHLQRTAGNQAVTSLVVQRSVAGDFLETIGEVATSLLSSIVGVPQWALTMLSGRPLDQAALQMLHKAGVSEEDLTDLVFQMTHPEAAGRKLGPGDKALMKEWKRIRSQVVRPALTAGADTSEKAEDAKGPSTGGLGGGIGGGPLSSSTLGAFGSEAPTRFRREVYERQLAAVQKKKAFFGGLAKDDREELVDGKELHKHAAGDGRALLEAAQTDLAAQKAAGDPDALKVKSIGVGSAYRSVATDMAAWENAFANHYARTEAERATMEGGPFGEAAVRKMANEMATWKAVPGFSNHGKGLAIDFKTIDGGKALGASSSQNSAWRKTWLHKWLVENAATYQFKPYTKEAWHWDHSPP